MSPVSLRGALRPLFVMAVAVTVALPAMATTGNPPVRVHSLLTAQAPSVNAVGVTVIAPTMTNPNHPLQTADLSADRPQATFQRIDFWYGNLNWSRYWEWSRNWGNIAWNKINAVPSSWKRWVLQNGLRAAFNGASEEAITRYYRSQGLYCPNRPWWLPLPSQLKPAWPVLTCAESAR